MNPAPNTVRAFYDDFLASRMCDYRLHKNARIEAAIQRILPFVTVDSNVLDVGCGIGLVAERVARKAKSGFVWACDISEQNIRYAKITVRAKNIAFRQVDILRQAEDLRRWVGKPVDLVVLVDVVEHLPPVELSPLLRNLTNLLTDSGTIVLTFPSPQYQRHLRETEPSALQVIDETVELPNLLRVAGEIKLHLRHFSFEDVWLRNQYVHCVFQANIELAPLKQAERTFLETLQCRLAQAFENRILVPFRRRKYVTRAMARISKQNIED